MKILCIGHIAYDILYKLEQYPKENTRIKGSKIENGGGGAANMAYLLGKWNMNVSLLGRIGKDGYGANILKELEEVSVNTKWIVQDKQETDVSTILITNQNRTIISPISKQPLKEIPKLDSPDLILLDGQEPILSEKVIEQYPNAITILDPPNTKPETISLAQKVTYMIASLSFVQKLTNKSISKVNLKQLENEYKQIEKIFPNTKIIITLEEQGALYKEEKQITHIKTIQVEEQDTTGAGDIFHAAFAYALLKDYPIQKCVEYANIAATYSVRYLGRKKSTPTLEQLEMFKNEFK